MATKATSTDAATVSPRDCQRPYRWLIPGAALLLITFAVLSLFPRAAEPIPSPISPAEMPLAERLAPEERTLIVFHADWCPPCHELMPTLAQVAERHPELPIRSVDVDAHASTSRLHGIDLLPTVVEFHHGKELRRVSGARSLAYLESWLATPQRRSEQNPAHNIGPSRHPLDLSSRLRE